jgi:uncharacterized membrane protein YoaK (UPF0700 family)
VTETEPVSEPDTLISAILLAATGGLLDAVVYTLHGHVFANAATGNVVLLGINMISGDWLQAGRHLVPVLAFLLGVAASRLLRLLPRLHAGLSVLLLEMLVLFIAGLLPPAFPEMAFTALIAFVSAFQVATFRQVGRFAYNSTFITGNLRECADGFVGYLLDPNRELRHHDFSKARKLTGICLFFLLGAILGAWGGPHLYNRVLWLAEPMLLVTTLRLYLDRSVPQSTTPSPVNQRQAKPKHPQPAA